MLTCFVRSVILVAVVSLVAALSMTILLMLLVSVMLGTVLEPEVPHVSLDIVDTTTTSLLVLLFFLLPLSVVVIGSDTHTISAKPTRLLVLLGTALAMRAVGAWRAAG